MRKKTVPDRLLERFKSHALIRGYTNTLMDFASIAPSTNDWSNPKIRADGANAALALSDDDGPLRKAFDKAALNPADPFDWAALLRMFAAAHFGPQAKRGPKQKWNTEKLCQLLIDYAAMKAAHPIYNDSRICRQLYRDFPTAYPSQGGGTKTEIETLRRYLSHARDPAQNDKLKSVEKLFKAFERFCLDNGETDLSDRDLRALAHQEALKLIAGAPV